MTTQNQPYSTIQRIYDFNVTNDTLSSGYDDFRESSFQIEEALEGFDIMEVSTSCTDYQYRTTSAKDLARYILSGESFQGTDVDRLDKAIDAIVFAVGSAAKLGLTPVQIDQAINIVMDANDAKNGCPKDEFGKLQKPANFPNPEPRLQALLDDRSNF